MELTASFGDSTALGTIEGSVSAFELNGEPSEDIGVLTLESAAIGDSESGFFTGDTTLAGTAGFEGEWGGRFFGNGESDGQPGSVAGDVRRGLVGREREPPRGVWRLQAVDCRSALPSYERSPVACATLRRSVTASA